MEYVKDVLGLRAFKLRLPFRDERTFIAPTGFGFTFGTLAFIQLIMAIGSQNNLIYLFVFSEISIALSSMFFTNSNILRISLQSLDCETAFAGEEAWVGIRLQTKKSKFSSNWMENLQVCWAGSKLLTNISQSSLTTPEDPSQFSLPWTPEKRGLQVFPKLRIQSSYPFGLLRAWKILASKDEMVVFPKRKGSSAFPVSALINRAQENLGLFFDLRLFQIGDSPRRIDWKASLRTGDFLIRRYEQEGSNQLHFSWHQTEGLSNFEERISQLALWVDLAEREGSLYSLSVGAWQSKRSTGRAHWQECLTVLANLKESEAD